MLGTPPRRDLFLTVLEQVRRRYQFVVVGYVVMPEHIHLLMSEPQEKNPSTVMQALKLGFARRVLADAKRKRYDHAEELGHPPPQEMRGSIFSGQVHVRVDKSVIRSRTVSLTMRLQPAFLRH